MLYGHVNLERKPADMVTFEPYGDGRWYIAYMADIPLGDGAIAVTFYVLERGKLVPLTHAVPPELFHRLGLLW